jgi:hypothetical protein
MKKFFLFLLFLIIVALAGYLYLFAVKTTTEGKVGVVEDLRSKKIVKVFSGDKRFIWQGAMWWWFSLYELSLKRSAEYDITVYPPPFEELKKSLYEIRFLCNVSYRVDPERYMDYINSGSSSHGIDQTIISFLKEISSQIVFRYFVPVYRAGDLSKDKDSITKELSASLKSKYENLGIDMLDMSITGDIKYPHRAVYNEGEAYIRELRSLDRENEKELRRVKSRLEQVRVEEEDRYEKYREMSKIIQENPDILKYIYIDKIGANVKVIISSDSGYPLNLESKTVKSSKQTKGEIDNLR